MFVQEHFSRRLRMLLWMRSRNSPSTASLWNCLLLFLGGLLFRCLRDFDVLTAMLRCAPNNPERETCVGICIFIDFHRCMGGQITKGFLSHTNLNIHILLSVQYQRYSYQASSLESYLVNSIQSKSIQIKSRSIPIHISQSKSIQVNQNQSESIQVDPIQSSPVNPIKSKSM